MELNEIEILLIYIMFYLLKAGIEFANINF